MNNEYIDGVFDALDEVYSALKAIPQLNADALMQRVCADAGEGFGIADLWDVVSRDKEDS